LGFRRQWGARQVAERRQRHNGRHGCDASSNGGFGFLFNGGGGADTLNYSNGRIAATNASFSVQGSAADISLTNTIATANNNTLLETTSSGGAVFNAQGSTLQGVISTDASSMSTVNLTQGTVWTMTGNSNATLLANDASDIIYPPRPGIRRSSRATRR
jgi:hypothetical protein